MIHVELRMVRGFTVDSVVISFMSVNLLKR